MRLICFYVEEHILYLAEKEASLDWGCRVIYKEMLPLQMQGPLSVARWSPSLSSSPCKIPASLPHLPPFFKSPPPLNPPLTPPHIPHFPATPSRCLSLPLQSLDGGFLGETATEQTL